jgi:hypothetical protein
MLTIKSVVGYITKELWLLDWYKDRLRRAHESTRESATYDKLKEGPKFRKRPRNIIPREELVDQVRKLITPTAASRFYPLIIREP